MISWKNIFRINLCTTYDDALQTQLNQNQQKSSDWLHHSRSNESCCLESGAPPPLNVTLRYLLLIRKMKKSRLTKNLIVDCITRAHSHTHCVFSCIVSLMLDDHIVPHQHCAADCVKGECTGGCNYYIYIIGIVQKSDKFGWESAKRECYAGIRHQVLIIVLWWCYIFTQVRLTMILLFFLVISDFR